MEGGGKMTIQVNYANFNNIIESAKFEIEKDVYQVITPIVNKVVINDEETYERYVEISIEDERLSNIVSKKYTRGDLLELIHLYQKLSNQIQNESMVECK